jgi:hypothetical protein
MVKKSIQTGCTGALAPCLLPSRSEDGSQRHSEQSEREFSERSETVDGRRSGGYVRGQLSHWY